LLLLTLLYYNYVSSVSRHNTVAAAPVKPVIGGVSASLAGQEFTLVSFDKFGYPEPLPPILSALPLYQEDDGFFSVNGSLDLTPRTALAPVNHNNYSMIRPLISDIPSTPGENSHIPPDHHQHYLNDDVISRFATPLPSRSTYYASLPNSPAASHKHVLRGGVISAASQAAPGDLRFRLSRHWTATTK